MVQKSADFSILEAVEHEGAVPAAHQDPCLAEQPQLLGDVGLGFPEQSLQLAHARLGPSQDIQHLEPHRVGQQEAPPRHSLVCLNLFFSPFICLLPHMQILA